MSGLKAYTKEYASYLSKAEFESLPDALIDNLKKCVLDTLGCAIAGSDKPEIVNFFKGFVEPEESGIGTIWGTGAKVTVDTAVTVNGAMSHTVELDDLHKPSKVHPGAVIIPNVLTVGSAMNISGREALLAIAMGYETMIRLGMALGTDSHRRRGWHATATCGSFGAAAASGKILKLEELQMANALGLAGTQTGGLMAYTADGSMSKRFHAGKSAQNGWQSAKLAKAGFTGPTYVLEAPDGGYAHAASNKYDLDILTRDMGKTFHGIDVGLKYYACCGHIHQALDAAIKLKNRYGIEPDKIDSVKVYTYDVAGMTWGFSKPPKNTVEAQFSFPYAVAVALTDGAAFLPQFSADRLSDPEILSLAAKVTVETDDKFTARYPTQWSSAVEITIGGEKYYEEVIGAKGDPCNPLSYDEVIAKFRSLSGVYIGSERQDRIIVTVDKLEQLENVNELTKLMIL